MIKMIAADTAAWVLKSMKYWLPLKFNKRIKKFLLTPLNAFAIVATSSKTMYKYIFVEWAIFK